MKLKGEPWSSSDGQEINAGRLLACEILTAFEYVGWELVASININTGIEWLREIPFVSEWATDAAVSSGESLSESLGLLLPADTWFFASQT